jgi:O-antigen/teichoic acid export membrane protein
VQSVLYPDIARLWAQGLLARFKRSVLQVEILLAGFGLAMLLFFLLAAEPLLRWTAGTLFVGATSLVIVQMAAVAINLMGIALRSALLAMGEQRQVLRVATLGTVAFFLVALLLVPRIGPMGANVGHVVLGGTTLIGLTLAFRRRLRRSQDSAAATPTPVAAGGP